MGSGQWDYWIPAEALTQLSLICVNITAKKNVYIPFSANIHEVTIYESSSEFMIFAWIVNILCKKNLS